MSRSGDNLRVLVLRDPHLHPMIETMLSLAAIRSEAVADLPSLCAQLWERPAQLIALEAGPDEQLALAACQQIRRFFQQPILVIEQGFGELARIRLLDAGADDVLTLPRGLAELSPRCKMLERRLLRQQQRDPQAIYLRSAGLSLDIDGRRLFLGNGHCLDLSANLTRLVAILLSAEGAIVTFDELASQFAATQPAQFARRAATMLRSLEQRLPLDGPRIDYVRGRGYRLRP